MAARMARPDGFPGIEPAGGAEVGAALWKPGVDFQRFTRSGRRTVPVLASWPFDG